MLQLNTYDNRSFDRGASRVKEVCWILVRAMLFMHSIPVPSRFKVLALRLFGAKVGTGVVIRSRVEVSFPWRLEIGDYVWIGNDVTILSLEKVTIGSHCCLSQRTFLCTGSHDYRKESFDLIVKPIVVEPHSWVSAQCMVCPGVTIGTGSVCAAGSIVRKDVPPHSIVEGVPAQVVKSNLK